MMDFQKGIIRVAEALSIGPDYTFDDFKETPYYNNYDEILKWYGIVNRKEFAWGTVSSDYDRNGNVSNIHIVYGSG